MVLDVVGAGGMGVVYAAYDPELDRKVALKLLRGGFGRNGGLAREAQTLARLSHPNVITVYDVGVAGKAESGEIFVAMELLDRTLAAYLREARRPWREVLDLFVKAGRGLAAAHAAGLVHRDFKPDNVLLGDDGRVRVTDFGLALSVADEETGPVTRVGTPAYMAPEQHE